MTPDQPRRTIVLGAGPVGLATALLLADQGYPVTVYEARESLILDDPNSYPIGVNPRGQETLRRIDPVLVDRLRAEGEVVAGFHIHVGTRRVAALESGTLVAATRASLTRMLAERVSAHAGVELVMDHRLTGLDLARRRLTFRRSNGEETHVDARDARVVAADGVWSAARTALAEQVADFAPRVGDWGVRFRVAFSGPGASAPGLDPAIHHIFTSRGIYTATLRDGVWGVVLSAAEGDPDAAALLADEATPENVAAVHAHVAEHAPLAAPLLRDEDYTAYFGRQPFGGAVVRCDRLAFEEWIVLVGDAAHSVIPSTGEGVNSGLEDADVLARHLASGSATPLTDFEAARLPDLDALGEYAWTLRDNLRSRDPARSATNVVLRIVGALSSRVPGVPDAAVENRLFGPHAGRTPYREAIGPWIATRRALYPPVHRVVEGVRRVLPGRGR